MDAIYLVVGLVLGWLVGFAFGLRRELKRAREQGARLRAIMGLVEEMEATRVDPEELLREFSGKGDVE